MVLKAQSAALYIYIYDYEVKSKSLENKKILVYLFYTITSIILCFTIGRFELINTFVIHFVIERMTAVDHKVKRTMTNN